MSPCHPSMFFCAKSRYTNLRFFGYPNHDCAVRSTELRPPIGSSPLPNTQIYDEDHHQHQHHYDHHHQTNPPNPPNPPPSPLAAHSSSSILPRSAYHHGEASLQGTIIGMAQNFVGSTLDKTRGHFYTGHHQIRHYLHEFQKIWVEDMAFWGLFVVLCFNK